MSTHELSQLELLAQIDDLTVRVVDWTNRESPWRPVHQCQSLLKRVLSRVETLRIRLEAPLVVATFGGTGTGKSSLVNAIVGQECTTSGRQRPTTRRPVLILHPRTEASALGLPLEEFDVVQRDADILRDIVIIDCPDPDTNETDSPGSNLARLHALLPHCDVLIYTSTQQKYRSARVTDEVAQAAAGCRLVFVQTHADLDADIREDWRRHLGERYEVPDVFFVDSVRAMQEQAAGQRPAGDMGRLLDLLCTQLAASERVRVRRANVLDLLQAALGRCRQLVHQEWPSLAQLDGALIEQRRTLGERMAGKLRQDLLTSRNLWERRLLSAVTETWGFSPFSSLLRTYHGLGALIASLSLYRARSTAQMALVGAMQGARWLEGFRQQRTAQAGLERAGACGLDDSLLREAEIVVEGYIHAAGLNRSAVAAHSMQELRHEAARVEDEFLLDARQRVDEIIADLSAANSGRVVRCWYELLFAAYLAYILFRMGKNFFYDSFWMDEPIIASDFYVPAGLFLLLWSGLLVMSFTRRLRRGLNRRIEELAKKLVDSRLADGLFPQLESVCRHSRRLKDELDALQEQTSSLRDELASPQLGVQRQTPLVSGHSS